MTVQTGFEKFAMVAQHERLEDFLDNAAVGIHLVNSDGIILYANKAELQLLGYSAEEYIGHNIAEFHAEQHVIENIFARLLNNEQLNNYEAKLKCKDGSIRQVLISSNVYFDHDKFQHTRCFTRDITDLKKVEKLLRFLNSASEELTTTFDTQEALDKILKFIVPHYADWFTIDELKPDGEVQLIKMAHANPEKIKWDEKYRSINPVDLNDQTEGSLGRVLTTGEAVLVSDITDEMIEASAKDAEHLEILKALNLKSAMIIPMLSKGKITGAVCFLSCNFLNKYDEHDFSFAKNFTNRIALTLENSRLYEEAKKEIEQRIEADKKKDEFISIASHELKTPVTSLKAYTQILQMTFEEKDDPKVKDMLFKMNKQVDKLTGLIVDLLDITKIDKGELALDMEEFDFNELVKETTEEMQTTTSRHKLNLQLGSCEIVKGDKNRIAQVITNFISNAIKYSPQANEIIITSDCANNWVKLCVRDFGVGIPEQEQSKIFRRFYRVSGKNKQYTFPGLGLGLYISSEIIKRHSGIINFQSSEQKGSTFCFQLPVFKS